jgi:hypothetical protein
MRLGLLLGVRVALKHFLLVVASRNLRLMRLVRVQSLSELDLREFKWYIDRVNDVLTRETHYRGLGSAKRLHQLVSERGVTLLGRGGHARRY